MATADSRQGFTDPARAVANDNRVPAGVLNQGVLTLHLVAQRVTWYPEAEDGPSKVVEAFGEAGHPPRIPGPLIRVPLGTTVDVTISNHLEDTLAVLGVGGRGDTLWIAPAARQRVRYQPPAAGSFLYAAGEKREGRVRFGGTSGQLVGGMIIDAGEAADDRVFITTGWDPVPIAGNPYFLALNGKSWPYTERFVQVMGDTVRWRVLNGGGGTFAHHPMHLHGFYFRVDARGGWDADTLYSESRRRWVVTENLPGLSSMSITWVPSRPGNWLFHCHNADHVAGRHRHVIAGRDAPYPPAPLHDAEDHLSWDMAGLVTAITVLPRPGAAAAVPDAPATRSLRLLVQERPRHYGQRSAFGYVLQDGDAEPAPDSIQIPGPALLLNRHEAVQITVVNRLATHTAVHWHGIELGSYYDGVAGWSSDGARVAPMIAPADSFQVRFAPPRAGTFIYHAHVTDHVQLSRGLYGPMIVLAQGQAFDPLADHVVLLSFGRPGGQPHSLLNGSATPAPLGRRREGTQRLRLINIDTEGHYLVTLTAAAQPMVWRQVAKDGFDTAGPPSEQESRVLIFPGETYDFTFASSADVLELRATNPEAPDTFLVLQLVSLP